MRRDARSIPRLDPSLTHGVPLITEKFKRCVQLHSDVARLRPEDRSIQEVDRKYICNPDSISRAQMQFERSLIIA